MDQKVSEMLLNQRYWDIFTVTDNCSVKKAIRMMDEKKDWSYPGALSRK